MILAHNIATKKIAYVFINSECRGIPYKNAQIRGKQAQKLFDEIFEFDEVHTIRDPSLSVIEDAVDRMKAQAKDFEDKVKLRNERNELISCDDTVTEFFKEQVNEVKKDDKTFDPNKCNYNKEILDQKNAFICVNKILQELDKEMT